MSNRKRLQRIIRAPNNVRFAELTALVEAFGFRLLRTSSSHHIFGKQGIAEQINLQDVNGKAKPYQVRQFLKLVERYNLHLEQDE